MVSLVNTALVAMCKGSSDCWLRPRCLCVAIEHAANCAAALRGVATTMDRDDHDDLCSKLHSQR